GGCGGVLHAVNIAAAAARAGQRQVRMIRFPASIACYSNDDPHAPTPIASAYAMHMFRLRIVLTLVVVTLVLYASVRAATTKVDATFASAALGPTVEVLEDPGGHMDFDAARAASGFKPAPNLGTNFG